MLKQVNCSNDHLRKYRDYAVALKQKEWCSWEHLTRTPDLQPRTIRATRLLWEESGPGFKKVQKPDNKAYIVWSRLNHKDK